VLFESDGKIARMVSTDDFDIGTIVDVLQAPGCDDGYVVESSDGHALDRPA
jgi:hypothetical protein